MRKDAKTVTGSLNRGQSKAPDSLSRFIELVNRDGLFDKELPDVYQECCAEVIGSGSGSPPRDIWVKVCQKVARSLSGQTREFLGAPGDLSEFLDRYALLKSARGVLLALAKRYRELRGTCSPGPLMVRSAELSRDVPFEAKVSLAIDRNGDLIVPEVPLLDALKGIRADRIRSCEICSRIFWAPRINSECCSEKCRKAYNQRNSRMSRR